MNKLSTQESRLTEEQVEGLYKMLKMTTEEQRQKIWDQLSVFMEKPEGPIRIKGDNITTLYPKH